MILQLLLKRWFLGLFYNIAVKETQHIVDFSYWLYYSFPHQEVIKANYLSRQCRLVTHGPGIKFTARLTINISITSPKFFGKRLNGLLVEKIILPSYHVQPLFMTIFHERHRGIDIIIGKVRVFSFQPYLHKQRLELERLEIRTKKAYELQGVETHGLKSTPVGIRKIIFQAEVHYMIIERGIMRQQGSSIGKVEKSLESLSGRTYLVVFPLFNDWVHDVAKHHRYGATRFQVHTELANNFAPPYPLRSYLDDIILKNVQACGLGIEHHYVIIVIDSQESPKISVMAISYTT